MELPYMIIFILLLGCCGPHLSKCQAQLWHWSCASWANCWPNGRWNDPWHQFLPQVSTRHFCHFSFFIFTLAWCQDTSASCSSWAMKASSDKTQGWVQNWNCYRLIQVAHYPIDLMWPTSIFDLVISYSFSIFQLPNWKLGKSHQPQTSDCQYSKHFQAGYGSRPLFQPQKGGSLFDLQDRLRRGWRGEFLRWFHSHRFGLRALSRFVAPEKHFAKKISGSNISRKMKSKLFAIHFYPSFQPPVPLFLLQPPIWLS